MVQIYNEVCDDLLAGGGSSKGQDRASALTSGGRGLKVVQAPGCPKEGGWELEGLSWWQCQTPEHLLECFARGRKRIIYAETYMNKHSSRSHCLLQLRVTRTARHPDPKPTSTVTNKEEADAGKVMQRQTVGVLTVVDLAGSERVKKSGAVTMSNRFREATAINGSLLVLGQVVQSLAKRQKHIPYRDSVLTKLLETSLSGKSRTALLVCAAAELEHAGESTTTMEFAARCMRVETTPVVNESSQWMDAASLARDLATTVLDGSGLPMGAAAAELTRSEEEIKTLTASLAMERDERKAVEARLKSRADAAEAEAAAAAEAAREREREAVAALEKARQSAASARGDAAREREETLDALRAEKSRTDALVTELAAERNAAAAAAAAAAATAAKEREASRRVIAELESQLSAERARTTVEIPRLSESVCAAGAKIMELSDRIAASERSRGELARKLGETEGALAEVRAERACLEASEAATTATVDRLAKREAELLSALEKLKRERDEAEETIAAQITSRAIAAASFAAEEEELKAALQKARRDYESAMNAAAEAEARVSSRVAALEAELIERTAGEASARASERGRAAAAAALSEDLELLRTTRRRQLEEVHAAAVAAAAEAETATRLQLAAGVVVMKRGRNGRMYRRIVRCDLDRRVFEWASVGDFKSMSVVAPPAVSVEWAEDDEEIIIHGPDRDYIIEVPKVNINEPKRNSTASASSSSSSFVVEAARLFGGRNADDDETPRHVPEEQRQQSQADAAATSWMRALHRRLGGAQQQGLSSSRQLDDDDDDDEQCSNTICSSTAASASLLSHHFAAIDVEDRPLYPSGMTYREWVQGELEKNSAAAAAAQQAQAMQAQTAKSSPIKTMKREKRRKHERAPGGGGGRAIGGAVSNAAGVVSSTAAFVARPLVKGSLIIALKAVNRLRANLKDPSTRPARAASASASASSPSPPAPPAPAKEREGEHPWNPAVDATLLATTVFDSPRRGKIVS